MNNTLLEAILITRALCHSGLERTDAEWDLAGGKCLAGAAGSELISEHMKTTTNEERKPHLVSTAHNACGAPQ